MIRPGVVVRIPRRRTRGSLRPEGLLLLAPAAVVSLLVLGYPFLRALQLSISRLRLTDGIDSEQLCGLCNFQSILADPFLPVYLRNQLIWVAGAGLLPILAGLLLALMMNRDLKLRWLWRAIVLIPWMMPLATVALTWRWLYDQQWGLLNYYLTGPTVADHIGFLTTRAMVWPSIIVVSVWMWFPYNYVAILAALQGVSPTLYEAARVDGAGSRAMFWHITLPSIRPVLALLLVLGVIWAMNDFTTIWLLTEGGPGNDSTTLGPLVLKTAFRFYDFGKASAFAVITMFVSLAFAVLYVRRTPHEGVV